MLAGLGTSQVSQIASQIKAMGNPQMMLQQMPQYRQVMDYVKANGGDAQAAFYAKAKEMGVDPDEVLQAVHGLK